MKRTTQRIALLVAAFCSGLASLAFAGPGSGPYGPFNTSGAYGGFGPYSPYVVRGIPVQQGLSTAYPIAPQAEIVTTRETVVRRHPHRVTRTTYVTRRVERPANAVIVPQRVVANFAYVPQNEAAAAPVIAEGPEVVGERVVITTTRTTYERPRYYRHHRHQARYSEYHYEHRTRSLPSRAWSTTKHAAHRTEETLESVGERTGRTIKHVFTGETSYQETAPAPAQETAYNGQILPPVGEYTTDTVQTVGEPTTNRVQRAGPPYANGDIDYNNPYR